VLVLARMQSGVMPLLLMAIVATTSKACGHVHIAHKYILSYLIRYY
jgi:hypothetical protein